MSKNIDLLPKFDEVELAVSRPAGKGDNFINLVLQTTDKVALQDGEDATELPHSFSAICARNRAPEAFEILQTAPLGARVKVRGHLTMRRAQVVGAGGRSYSNALAQLEITDAEITATIQPTDHTV